MPHHRSRKTPLLIQPVIRLSRQLLNRIPREELRRNPLSSRLIRYCFRAILAELEDLPVFVGTWPGTALTIEPGNVVESSRTPRGPASPPYRQSHTASCS